jgi:hypothetical protein
VSVSQVGSRLGEFYNLTMRLVTYVDTSSVVGKKKKLGFSAPWLYTTFSLQWLLCKQNPCSVNATTWPYCIIIECSLGVSFQSFLGTYLPMTYESAGKFVDVIEQADQIHSGPGWSPRDRWEETQEVRRYTVRSTE